MKLEYAAKYNKGLIRDNNEDNFYLDGLYLGDAENETVAGERLDTPFHDFAVSDGMGGELYGEIASRIAAQTLSEFQPRGFRSCFESYFETTNARVLNESAVRRASRIGATIAILHFEEKSATAFNIGDSRIYMYHQDILMRLTEDHRSRNSLGRTVLLQHFGISPEEFILEPYISEEIILDPGMVFILSTDGLTDMVSDYDLQRIMDACKGMEPETIAGKLIDAALENGGKDNVTVIVVKIK